MTYRYRKTINRHVLIAAPAIPVSIMLGLIVLRQYGDSALIQALPRLMLSFMMVAVASLFAFLRPAYGKAVVSVAGLELNDMEATRGRQRWLGWRDIEQVQPKHGLNGQISGLQLTLHSGEVLRLTTRDRGGWPRFRLVKPKTGPDLANCICQHWEVGRGS